MFFTRLVKLFRNYFAFSRTEMRGVFVLFLLLLLLIYSPFFYKAYFEKQYTEKDYGKDWQQMDSLVRLMEVQSLQLKKNREVPSSIKLVTFNPNRAKLETLKTLGFTPSVAERIINYREAGGKFFQKSDLLKIYGLSKHTYRQVYSYIDLPEVYANQTDFQSEQKTILNTNISVEKWDHIDVNTADTATLKKLKGIGPVLSVRIIKYRNLLGGYIEADQLEEVYGLQPESLELIRDKIFISPNFKPKMININEADISELIRHPYIKFEIAKAIVEHRNKYGPYLKPEDIKEVKFVNEQLWSKIAAYINI